MWKLSNRLAGILTRQAGTWTFCKERSLFTPKASSTMSATQHPNDGFGHDFKNHRLVWVDLEMSGLNIDDDHILEVACVVTDANLNILANGPNLVIHQPDIVLESMNDWCKQHHGQSGLTQAVRDSKISLEEAERQVLEFVSAHTPMGKCPLAGNSVHEDKRFLTKYMPQFMNHLHYRIMDVSTVKEICRRWFPEEFALAPRKQAAHRALDDILESIKELQYYRRTIFRKSTAPT